MIWNDEERRIWKDGYGRSDIEGMISNLFIYFYFSIGLTTLETRNMGHMCQDIIVK